MKSNLRRRIEKLERSAALRPLPDAREAVFIKVMACFSDDDADLLVGLAQDPVRNRSLSEREIAVVRLLEATLELELQRAGFGRSAAVAENPRASRTAGNWVSRTARPYTGRLKRAPKVGLVVSEQTKGTCGVQDETGID
jgi:hypothetical protein